MSEIDPTTRRLALALASRPGASAPVREVLAMLGDPSRPGVREKLILHHDGDRSAAGLEWMSRWDLGAALAHTDDVTVVDELVEHAPAQALVGYVASGPQVHPHALALAFVRAEGGDAEAAWAVLNHLSGTEHARVVVVSSHQVRSSAGWSEALAFLRWLGHACQHPDLLTGWVGLAPLGYQPAVAWMADQACAGVDTRSLFVTELIGIGQQGGQLPAWLARAGMGNPWRGAQGDEVWEDLVTICHDERLAVQAVQRFLSPWTAREVATRRWLLGSRAVAQALCDRLHVALPEEFDPAAAVHQQQLAATALPTAVLAWLYQDEDDAPRVAPAVAHLEAMAASDRLLPGMASFALVAAELACVAAPGSPAGQAALRLVHVAQGLGGVDEASDRDRQLLQALTGFAAARAGDTGMGSCPVPVASLGRQWRREWLTTTLAHWWGTCPGRDDPTFVRTLLDVAPGFTGTFDELVAVVQAVLA